MANDLNESYQLQMEEDQSVMNKAIAEKDAAEKEEEERKEKLRKDQLKEINNFRKEQVRLS